MNQISVLLHHLTLLLLLIPGLVKISFISDIYVIKNYTTVNVFRSKSKICTSLAATPVARKIRKTK